MLIAPPGFLGRLVSHEAFGVLCDVLASRACWSAKVTAPRARARQGSVRARALIPCSCV